jgi:co-chaperonin GroES (HSP10)
MTTPKAPTLGTDGFHKMSHEADPKKLILDALGSAVPMTMGAKVCVATYIRPSKTGGGIIRPDSHKREDVYQGKVGLIIGMGPIAFKETKDVAFGGVVPKLHDWVIFSSTNGSPFSFLGLHCRFIDDVQLHAIVEDPDSVY